MRQVPTIRAKRRSTGKRTKRTVAVVALGLGLLAGATAAPVHAAPPAPAITSPSWDEHVPDETVTIAGTASGDTDLVRVIVDGSAVATTGPVNGYWSAGVALADGPHEVRARARDASGTWGPVSDPIPFVVDTVHPPAPVITAPTHGQIVAFSTVTIEGTAEPGVTVTVDISTGGTVTAVADETGAWSASRGFADTTHTLVARAMDAAGNVGLDSVPVTFEVDTLDPAPPIIYTPGHATFHGSSTLTLTGSAEPGSTVKVFRGTTIVMQTAATDGTWSGTASFAEGTHTITARTSDDAGHTSGPTAPRTFTIDLTPPPAPTILTPRPGSFVTHSYVVSGTAEPHAMVELITNDHVLVRVPADPAGHWSITRSSFSGGQLLSARAVDRAGNVGPRSPEIAFTVDASPPPRPKVLTPNGTIFLPTQTPRIEGTATDDIGVLAVQLEYYDLLGVERYRPNATCMGCPSIEASWQTTFAPFPGRYIVKVYTVDRAGNRSLPTEIEIIRL